VLGEVVRVLDVDRTWVRTRGPDGYEGWCPGGPLLAGRVDADRWRETATLVSLGTAASGLGRIPWGARVRPLEGGRVELPDGRRVEPAEPGRLVDSAELGGRCPRDGEAVVRSALEWLDVPYVWGGRTELGTDCSGLVQSVLGVHGVALPRDSHAQRAALPDAGGPLSVLDGGRGRDVPEPGDLLFFAPEGRGITHVALSIGGWKIVHAAASNGRVATDDLTGDRSVARLLAGSIVACTRPF